MLCDDEALRGPKGGSEPSAPETPLYVVTQPLSSPQRETAAAKITRRPELCCWARPQSRPGCGLAYVPRLF